MFALIGHLLRVRASKKREAIKHETRSPRWRTVEKNFLAAHPRCAGCASTRNLQVHHKKPFHLFPGLELVESNLITLCMGLNECHLHIGHGGDWKAFNPHVEDDAAELRLNPKRRELIWIRAKAARQNSFVTYAS